MGLCTTVFSAALRDRDSVRNTGNSHPTTATYLSDGHKSDMATISQRKLCHQVLDAYEAFRTNDNIECLEKSMLALRSALEQPVISGKWVPLEPTDAMISAAMQMPEPFSPGDEYRTMLSVVPPSLGQNKSVNLQSIDTALSVIEPVLFPCGSPRLEVTPIQLNSVELDQLSLELANLSFDRLVQALREQNDPRRYRDADILMSKAADLIESLTIIESIII